MSTGIPQIVFNGRNGDGPVRGRAKACRTRRLMREDLERERAEWLEARNAAISAAAENHRCAVCGEVCSPNARACRLHVAKDDEFLICDEVIRAGFGDVKWKKIPQRVVDLARSIVAARRLQAPEPERPSWQDWVRGEVPDVFVAR